MPPHRESWLAIDPKGVIGEPAYEAGALLRNLPAMSDPKEITIKRLDILSASLNLDRRRLCAWALAQAVLSAWWSIEDGESEWYPSIQCAKLLANLLKD